jgi:hypothetical protein
MRCTLLSLLSLLADAALAGCNGNAVVSASTTTSGGAGGATATATVTGGGGVGGAGGSTTASTTIPEACRAATDAPGPHAFTVRMTNAGGAPAFVHDSCGIELAITACADGYAAPLAVSEPCSYVRCDELPDAGCPSAGICGPCNSDARAVTASESPERALPGVTYESATGGAGCSCTALVPLPAAKYRVRVPVWTAKADAETGRPPTRYATADFELPAPGGVVEVAVGGP